MSHQSGEHSTHGKEPKFIGRDFGEMARGDRDDRVFETNVSGGRTTQEIVDSQMVEGQIMKRVEMFQTYPTTKRGLMPRDEERGEW